MRSIWIGSMSFGLVNIPIKLFSAVQESSLDLDMLDSKDHSNIKFKRVNENTGKEKARGKKISVPKMKVVHRQNDNLMDMLKASLAGSKRKSA